MRVKGGSAAPALAAAGDAGAAKTKAPVKKAAAPTLAEGGSFEDKTKARSSAKSAILEEARAKALAAASAPAPAKKK